MLLLHPREHIKEGDGCDVVFDESRMVDVELKRVESTVTYLKMLIYIQDTGVLV